MSSESNTCKKQSHTTTLASLSPSAEKENEVIKQIDTTVDVLNVREASRLLRVHPDKLTDLARQGKIPAGAVGSRWRFSLSALLAHLAKPQKGPIKPTRRLVDYPPAKLIERVN